MHKVKRAVMITRASLRRVSKLQACRAFFAPAKPAGRSKSPSDDDSSGPIHSQSFVQTRLLPGEWDPETHTNPLYRPKYRSNARIWSKDDFLNQPQVGFSAEHESFAEAMATISWLSSRDQEKVYSFYVDIMRAAAEKKSAETSHEYVVRVVAQKFGLTPERVAGIIQLQHNEQQLKRKLSDPNCDTSGYPSYQKMQEMSDMMDAGYAQEIRNAYQSNNAVAPESFVEDPVPAKHDSKAWQTVDDVFDVDQMLADAHVREDRKARIAIDGYSYVADVDDVTVEIPMSEDCQSLLKAHKKLTPEEGEENEKIRIDEANPLPASGERRQRWKYVAQVVNTRDLYRKRHEEKMKQSSAKHHTTGYTNNHPANTLVEREGSLRAANQSDIQETPWKAVRHVCEHTYRGVKQGWLDRTVRGHLEAWGPAPAPQAVAEEKEEPAADTEADEDLAAKDGSDDREADEATEKEVSNKDNMGTGEKKDETKGGKIPTRDDSDD